MSDSKENNNNNINKNLPHKSPYSSFYGGATTTTNIPLEGQTGGFGNVAPVNHYGQVYQGGVNAGQGNIQQQYGQQQTQQYPPQQYPIQHAQQYPPQQVYLPSQPIQTAPHQQNFPKTIQKPFMFFPSVESVNRTNRINKYSSIDYPHPVTQVQPPIYNQPMIPHPEVSNLYGQASFHDPNIYMGKASPPTQELIKLQYRYSTLVSYNTELLPSHLQYPYKITNFVKTSTILALFFTFAIKSSNLMSQGGNKSELWKKSFRFLAFYIGTSFLFNLFSRNITDQGFDILFTGKNFPSIDSELQNYKEMTPILKL